MFEKYIKKMMNSIVIAENLENSNMEVDYVLKRDGSKEEMEFDKILRRIKNLSEGLSINPTKVTKKVCSQTFPNIKTSEIDELAAQLCASLSTEHPDYGILAARIIVSNHHKNTYPSFTETTRLLYDASLVTKEHYDIVQQYGSKLNDVIDYNRDFDIDYFGFKTLEKSYLMKIKGVITERPQHLFMRVAVGIHGIDIKDVIETYEYMSKKYFTHATPTLFNAATQRPQLSSCFLLAMKEDSIDGIFSTLKDCAMISKWAGGIGLHIHNVRAKNSHIKGTNGISNGLVPMLRVFNNTARYVDQCVHPETLIYTTQGPLAIQDVTMGETQIYNKNGATEIIDNVLEHPYNGNIIKIKTQHSIDDLIITPEHPVYVLKNQKCGVDYKTMENRLDKKLIDFEWTEIKDLNRDDMIAFSIPTYSKDIETISQDDCYIYGVILGDGCMNNKDKNGYISIHSENKKYILDKVIRYFNNKYIEHRIETHDNTTRLYWDKNINMPFRYNDVYNSQKEKYIHHKWLNLPIEKSKYIIKGLIDTDSCKANELVFDNTSRNLIESVRFLCMKMGILTSGYERSIIGETPVTKNVKTITNKKLSYILRIPKTLNMCELLEIEYTSQVFKFFKYKNYMLTRITDISQDTYDGTLYDLQLKSEHNYLIHNGLIHNGGGKRNGSIAMYLEPWHRDIRDFLLLRKNHGNEEDRARDLFYALWIPDLFMKRVQNNGKWTLMCPEECPGLSDVYGDEFEKLYTSYESRFPEDSQYIIDARELWFAILESQIETGTPYLCYKDASNIKSNQKNLGTIKSSNLCTEIIEYSAPDQYAVCNLASIGLSRFVVDKPVTLEDVFQSGFIKPNSSVKIYTISTCSFCVKAKQLFKDYNIDFKEILMENTQEKTAFFDTINDNLDDNEKPVMTFPQIFIDEKRIGGYTDLYQHFTPRKVFDYEELHKVSKIITKNLNKIIDINYYPIPETRKSNKLHRPIGIGIQGLADVFAMLKLPFASGEAQYMNEKIFETIYFASMETSMEICKRRTSLIDKLIVNKNILDNTDLSDGKIKSLENENRVLEENLKLIPEELNRDTYRSTYSSFIGSPMWEGKFQFDLWNQSPLSPNKWEYLREDIKNHGIRNSLLLAPMPTASTSQILGNNECFEPFTSNIYIRRTLAGEFVVINKHLIRDLLELNIWNEDMKNEIIRNNGSIQNISKIPNKIKEVYKTVWEIGNKPLIDMAATRGKYICQSQSLNLFVDTPNFNKLNSMHFYAWSKGLKTGIYYLRTKAAAQAQQFTIEPTIKDENGSETPISPNENLVCVRDNNDCEACGS